MRIYDISVPISPATPVYRGDPPVQIEPVAQIEKGASLNLSRLTLGSHTGTHVDAPYHFLPQGASVDSLPLELLYGHAQVREFPNAVKALGMKDLEEADIPPGTQRLLLKTRNSSLWRFPHFQEDFVYIETDAARWLVQRGVRLVGLDYLSVEAFGSQDFPIHRILLEANVIIVEGLDLSGVSLGEYTLICMPLKIEGGDGAPARAVLVSESE